ncbi:ABC transporter permease [Cryobacterium sp. 10C3]|nr:ABC transporter permease [Cryobacterium sp. 10C3]MDY7557414.1 ABC transporter permease [Cryobacterium sp. 10C3]
MIVRDSLILAQRTVTKMVRNPEQFLDVSVQPIVMTVIFVFIFGGAIAGTSEDYLQFALPGIIVQTIMTTAMTIGVNLNSDLKNGVFDRFRSLPIARSAPSWAP